MEYENENALVGLKVNDMDIEFAEGLVNLAKKRVILSLLSEESAAQLIAADVNGKQAITEIIYRQYQPGNGNPYCETLTVKNIKLIRLDHRLDVMFFG